MIRVHIICEGQTEEMFVKEILTDYFEPKEIYLIPTLIGKPGHKGGNVNFERLFTDLRARLLSDKTAYCTTLFDFYGLSKNFPGKDEALNCVSVQDKAERLLDVMTEKLIGQLGEDPLKRLACIP